MNEVKKKASWTRVIGLYMVFLTLSQTVSATTLTYDSMFPECTQNATADFMGGVRCGAGFLMPNLHMQALWDLVIYAFVGSLNEIGANIINEFFTQGALFFKGVGDLNVATTTVAFWTLIALTVDAPFRWVYGIVSSILVYVIMIVFEFIKTYLLIATSWSLWSVVIFREVRYMNKLTNIGFMTAVISILLIGGSILLFVYDVNVWRAL